MISFVYGCLLSLSAMLFGHIVTNYQTYSGREVWTIKTNWPVQNPQTLVDVCNP